MVTIMIMKIFDYLFMSYLCVAVVGFLIIFLEHFILMVFPLCVHVVDLLLLIIVCEGLLLLEYPNV